ncbi:hypothetical protein PSQ40_05040 [Curvibacter sp. HBC61]|uniref:CcoQ/FixQ family Cbb3-type cytochrome c oxidase assembly chaperone n=1 Tax=Curvibacter cyanobacteriorum TaxID=3026422 RepID=A0ABT5MVR2_9BURK|nr:hypothetical protein [Curvibacter sp. HBC61]MDD0837932.1 hypothetical protein [Curvibacter sp. HBC61]
MSAWVWFIGGWALLLVLMAWCFVRAGRRIEDDAGEFAEDLAEAMIEDIQARRTIKPKD